MRTCCQKDPIQMHTYNLDGDDVSATLVLPDGINPTHIRIEIDTQDQYGRNFENYLNIPIP